MTKPELIRRALLAVPDLPRWIEARAILLSGCCSVFESEAGLAIRNDAPLGGLVALVGRPAPEQLAIALSDRPPRELLCQAEDEAWLAEHFPSWTRERAVLHELADPQRLAEPDPRVRLLQPTDDLQHVPADVREELETARCTHAIHAAFAGGKAVSFAYSFWRTEGLFDISIDTLPEFRRRGLARRCASELIRAEVRGGRAPVWGATSSNVASLQLARSLGFVPADAVVIATCD